MTIALTELLEASSLQVAPQLLGMTFGTVIEGRITSVRLTEVEAYGGADDPASHAFRGRTDRNAPMFGPPGVLYVYRSYGIHWCANIVTGPESEPQAVLLRGGTPLEGRSIMEARRGRPAPLTDGPGRLTQALGIGASDNDVPLGAGRVFLEPGEAPWRTEATPRIGITKATSRRWRFAIVD